MPTPSGKPTAQERRDEVMSRTSVKIVTVPRMPMILFDLDSTLCDTRHRRRLIPSQTINVASAWEEYSNACVDDEPIAGNVALLKLLHAAGYPIMILSARSDSATEQTKNWLDKHDIPTDFLVLRKSTNDQSSGDYKREIIQQLLDEEIPLGLLIDDWPEVAQACGDLIPTLCSIPPEHFSATITAIKDSL